MIDQMCVLQSSDSWELVPLPLGMSLVSCRWLYTAEVGLDGKIDALRLGLWPKDTLRYLGWITINFLLPWPK